jgi:hypothetical protein
LPEIKKRITSDYNVIEKRINKILKRKTFEDDELYKEFFEIVKSVFTELSDKAKKNSLVVEHKNNIIPIKYNKDNDNKLSYDEDHEKLKKEILITQAGFFALFSKLINTRKPRTERVARKTVDEYWKILSCLHKNSGAPKTLK